MPQPQILETGLLYERRTTETKVAHAPEATAAAEEEGEDESADVAVEDEPPTDTLKYTLGPRVLVQSCGIRHSLLSARMDSQNEDVESPSIVRRKMINDEHIYGITWPDHITPEEQSNGVLILEGLLRERKDKMTTISAVKKRKNSPARVSKDTSQPYVTIAGASSHLSDEELESLVVRVRARLRTALNQGDCCAEAESRRWRPRHRMVH